MPELFLFGPTLAVGFAAFGIACLRRAWATAV